MMVISVVCTRKSLHKGVFKMSDGKTKDAKKTEQVDEFFSNLKKMYDKNEEPWTKMWDQVLKTEDYANFQGLFERQMMVVQESMKKNATDALNVAQIPSKDDLANVAKQIIATEEKVDDVIFRMDDLTDMINHALVGEINGLKKQVVDLQKTIDIMKDFLMKGKVVAETAVQEKPAAIQEKPKRIRPSRKAAVAQVQEVIKVETPIAPAKESVINTAEAEAATSVED